MSEPLKDDKPTEYPYMEHYRLMLLARHFGQELALAMDKLAAFEAKHGQPPDPRTTNPPETKAG